MRTLPDRDTWRDLLRPALRVIDSLKSNGYGALDFRLGGGTVLMFRFDHRVSKDIDVFIDDAQALGFISPRLNEVASREADAYQEQANSLKLTLDAGDIDIIVAGTVIPGESLGTLDFEGRCVALDATSEILAKKMLYRAESFKPRDVFDMSCALALDPAAASKAIRATRSVHPALVRRLSALAGVEPRELTSEILMTETGRPHAESMVARFIAALVSAGEAAPGAR